MKKLKLQCVMGNTDESLWKQTKEHCARQGMSEQEIHRMEALDGWTSSRITDGDRKYLSTFKPTIEVKLGESSLKCYHGSPSSNTQGILPTTTEGNLSKMLSGHEAAVFAGGHMHSQMVRRWTNSLEASGPPSRMTLGAG